jgi:hypothetical protein
LSDAERQSYARAAAALLARVAADRRGPMAAGLRTVEPALAVAMRDPGTARSAAAALAELPDPDAQRSVFDAMMDPSRPADFRSEAAKLLVASIRRFGPLITKDQESLLANGLGGEPDPVVAEALADVVAALRSRGKPAAAPAAPPPSPPQPGVPR